MHNFSLCVPRQLFLSKVHNPPFRAKGTTFPAPTEKPRLPYKEAGFVHFLILKVPGLLGRSWFPVLPLEHLVCRRCWTLCPQQLRCCRRCPNDPKSILHHVRSVGYSHGKQENLTYCSYLQKWSKSSVRILPQSGRRYHPVRRHPNGLHTVPRMVPSASAICRPCSEDMVLPEGLVWMASLRSRQMQSPEL